MHRRDVPKVLALVTAMPCSAAEPARKQPLGLVIHSYWIRRDKPLCQSSAAWPIRSRFWTPLRRACLAPKYRTTLDDVPAREMAEAMTCIRRHKHATALPTITGLPHAEQLRVEADNIARCLKFASMNL